jgi:hypothetical protein
MEQLAQAHLLLTLAPHTPLAASEVAPELVELEVTELVAILDPADLSLLNTGTLNKP